MSKQLGFFVVSKRTGYMLEGRDHAAKIFDTNAEARRACKPLQDQIPVPVQYADVAKALLKGSAFCFDNEIVYDKFIKGLRNDLPNKPFIAFSKDRNFVRWRHTPDAKTNPAPDVAADARRETVSASAAPVQTTQFNPDLLVRGSNG